MLIEIVIQMRIKINEYWNDNKLKLFNHATRRFVDRSLISFDVALWNIREEEAC
jgi:hypothetical protein